MFACDAHCKFFLMKIAFEIIALKIIRKLIGVLKDYILNTDSNNFISTYVTSSLNQIG